MKTSLTIVAALVAVAAANASATSVPLVNASFEDPPGGKTVGDATWSNIPGWTSTGPSVDSGVETFDPAPLPEPELGSAIAFLRSNDGAIYQTTAYTLQSDDRIRLTFYERDDFEADELTVRFYYDDGLTRTVFDSQTVAVTQFVPRPGPLTFQALTASVPAAGVGSLLGIEFENTTDDGNTEDGEWLWIDAVTLAAIPEPGSATVMITAVATALARTRRGRRLGAAR